MTDPTPEKLAELRRDAERCIAQRLLDAAHQLATEGTTMSDWRECRVVRDRDGGLWVGNGGAWISWEEPEAVSDDWLHRYYGPLTPVLDADGHPVPELLATA